MGVVEGLIGLSLVTGAYGIKKSQDAADEGADAAERREKIEQKRADISTARERTKQVRQARIARAQALSQSQSGAGTGGSGLAGTQANIGGSASRSAQFLGQNQALSSEISDLNISSGAKVAKYKSQAALGAGIASAANTALPLFEE